LLDRRTDTLSGDGGWQVRGGDIEEEFTGGKGGKANLPLQIFVSS